MYVCLWGCTHVYRYPQRPECWILLGQKLQRVINCPASVVGTGFGSFGSAANTVNHQSISPFLSVCMRVCEHVCLLANFHGGGCKCDVSPQVPSTLFV